MHFCTAIIALQNEDGQTVQRDEYSPISWPEIDVIQVIHGEGAVRSVIPFVIVEQNARDERERLALIYGREVVEGGNPLVPPVYPGRNPSMQLEAPEYTIRAGLRWLNPLSGEVERLGEDGTSTPVPRGPVTIDEHNTVTPGPKTVRVETVGDPRPGNPDTGEVKTRAASGRFAKRDETFSEEKGF